MRRGETSRDELFLIYGIIICVLILVIFFTKINQLFDFQNLIQDYAANELALTADAVGSRSGYTSIGYSVRNLNQPTVAFENGNITLKSKAKTGAHSTSNATFKRSRSLFVPAADTKTPVDAEKFRFVNDPAPGSSPKLSLEGGANCPPAGAPASDPAFVGVPLDKASSILIATSDPKLGCDLYATYAAKDPAYDLVQRVIVPQSALEPYSKKQVVVFAR